MTTAQHSPALDERLDELAALLCHWTRLRAQGIRPVSVQAVALGVIEEIFEMVNEEEE